MLIDYALLFGTGIVMYELSKSILSHLGSSRNCFNSDKVLLVGYEDKFIRKPITIDMNIDSHVLIIGLSNCGKSKLAEGMLQSKSVTIVNAFPEDFPTLKGQRIVGEDEILNYLEHVLDGRTNESKVHYLLIDEMLVLMRNKKIEKALAELLAVARHYNLYIVALGQEGTREVIKCKNLFNVRICMKQLEESSFRTVLGCSVEDRFLKQREFYIVDNKGLRKGKTYDIN